ncbi:hypothetical protein SUDANB37_01549 [Streptomyces sp. enrichment culture]
MTEPDGHLVPPEAVGRAGAPRGGRHQAGARARSGHGARRQFSQILIARTWYGERGTQVPLPGYVSNSPVSAQVADW